jgi:hypothetical protein
MKPFPRPGVLVLFSDKHLKWRYFFQDDLVNLIQIGQKPFVPGQPRLDAPLSCTIQRADALEG